MPLRAGGVSLAQDQAVLAACLAQMRMQGLCRQGRPTQRVGARVPRSPLHVFAGA